jgi:hypothetical protein
MYTPTTAEDHSDFFESGPGRVFLIKFAANFYELKPSHAAYPAWIDFVSSNSGNMDLLLQSLDNVANGGLEKRPTQPQVKKEFKHLLAKKLAGSKQNGCMVCNSKRFTHNVETTIDNKTIILDPKKPIPCRAYHTMAPCANCSNGDNEHTLKRFLPPVEDGQVLEGLEEHSARSFIDDCRILLRQTEVKK